MSSLRKLRAGALRHDERGQAVVEFALILIPFVLLLGGIIQFGIGLNYWLDLQRVANQGARWAAVNNWPPDCPAGTKNVANGGLGCANTISTTADCPGLSQPSGLTLQDTLRCQLLTKGEENTTVNVCYPTGYSGARGDPVTVRLERPFNVVGIPFFGGFGSIKIRGSATVRLEQAQTGVSTNGLLTGVGTC